MAISFQPLLSGVLLKLEPEPEKSQIIAVQSREGLCRFAEVTAIGPEVRDIEVGQRVLASITAGVELDVGLLISESAILGVLDD